ncbi:hypothetical protein LCGC14_1167530 [marine sediment metagenome]|uniref:Uncharacterized protein n=1 Tax=marine sediment metagenome TaxID=412755 RepID=A0A0F9PWB9_9ZZZZ
MKKELDKLFTKIIEEMHLSLKEYGTYTFWDKGPQEVMGVSEWASKIENLPADEARELLETICDYSKEGAKLANCIVDSLDDSPEDWWNKLMVGDKLEY